MLASPVCAVVEAVEEVRLEDAELPEVAASAVEAEVSPEEVLVEGEASREEAAVDGEDSVGVDGRQF